MANKKMVVLMAFIILMPLQLFAEEEPIEKKYDRYTIELIVFEHKSKKQESVDEFFPSEPGQVNQAKAIRLIDPSNETFEVPDVAEFTLDEEGELDTDKDYWALDKEAWHLSDAHQRLRWSKNYRIVHHMAWRQTLAQEIFSKAVIVEGGEQYQPFEHGLLPNWEVEGTVQVKWVSAPVVKADLIFRKPSTERKGFFKAQTYDKFRLTQAHRLKKGEPYYFDHPKFGAIVLISPYQSAHDMKESS